MVDFPIVSGLLALAVLASPATAEERMGFSTDEIQAHRLIGSDEIEVPASMVPGFAGIQIEVEISTTGDVTEARVASLPATEMSGGGVSKPVRIGGNEEGLDPEPALAAVKAWKFRPFTFHERPIPATGVVRVRYHSAGRWLDNNAVFPPIDYATLHIELYRDGGCFGSCPIYSVSIDGAGKAVFTPDGRLDEPAPKVVADGMEFLQTPRISRVDRATLDGLIDRFRKAHFFGLAKSYSYPVSDSPTYTLRFSTGGHVMTVIDHVGEADGMPRAVTELENAVDEVVGTRQWIGGEAQTASGLLAAGLDVASEAAQEIALSSLDHDDAVVIGLIEHGMPLDTPFTRYGPAEAVPVGVFLLTAAIGRSRPALFTTLASRGWLGRTPRETLNRAFADGAAGCDPALAEALIRNGADPNAHGSRGKTALMNVAASYSRCKEATGSTISVLRRYAVDPNAVDEEGRTALFDVGNSEVLAQLIAAGARVDIRAKDGSTAIDWTNDDSIALCLLEAGADPSGKDFNGQTLRQRAPDKMPATLAWLDAHHIK